MGANLCKLIFTNLHWLMYLSSQSILQMCGRKARVREVQEALAKARQDATLLLMKELPTLLKKLQTDPIQVYWLRYQADLLVQMSSWYICFLQDCLRISTNTVFYVFQIPLLLYYSGANCGALLVNVGFMSGCYRTWNETGTILSQAAGTVYASLAKHGQGLVNYYCNFAMLSIVSAGLLQGVPCCKSFEITPNVEAIIFGLNNETLYISTTLNAMQENGLSSLLNVVLDIMFKHEELQVSGVIFLIAC